MGEPQDVWALTDEERHLIRLLRHSPQSVTTGGRGPVHQPRADPGRLPASRPQSRPRAPLPRRHPPLRTGGIDTASL